MRQTCSVIVGLSWFAFMTSLLKTPHMVAANDACSTKLTADLLIGWLTNISIQRRRSRPDSAHPTCFRSCPLNATYVNDVVDQFEQCFSTNLTRPLRLLVQSNVFSQSGLSQALISFQSSTGIGVTLEIYNESIAARQAVEELQVRMVPKNSHVKDSCMGFV